ncbi:BZ3500_MvSof-1268-A1-R1_Chr6-3g08697 [Microbotryum saponariae]|uniref:BZ3500_MvSof-1268-A1-R1_Chr6-3g08697 protein n=1 Tax=Microbotryum saponariae TaxID=289078 RepID=A0A2X0KIP3_9BASI|nr:BZ3500_MvSof-1268-A1-R1_Chr6-3g08697 [Microbotryum saponariae]SDA07298.1 BZ3501_MvSof-1269-A2-R1_Chr6-2g08400 [Microbotryum saponariae]
MPGIPSIPMPGLVRSFFSHFPLVVYDAPPTATPAPSKPTLWLLGPPPASSSSSSTDPTSQPQSLDPYSRYAATLARFSQLGAVELRWCSSPLGAPQSRLPALHLPNGDLLSREEIPDWFHQQQQEHRSKQSRSSSPTSSSRAPSGGDVEASRLAYLSLIQSALLPALLSSLYLAPKPVPLVPSSQAPYLTSLVQSLSGRSERTERIKQIKALQARHDIGFEAGLDVDKVELGAKETIEAVEVKLASMKKSSWWDGAESATDLDAWLYTCLSIVLDLPRNETTRSLKDQLDRAPTLMNWVQERRV